MVKVMNERVSIEIFLKVWRGVWKCVVLIIGRKVI